MQISRDGLRRFVRMFLGIEETEFGYHQTLTFNRDVSEKEAKKLQSQLFKKLIRKFPTIVLFYAMRRQRRTNRLHFHVRVHFYREDGLPFPEKRMERNLRTIIFAEWNELNSGKLARRANKLNRNPKDLSYLLEEVTVADSKAKTIRPKANVWGYGNQKVLNRHFTEPSSVEIENAVPSLKPKSRKKKRVPLPYYSMSQLRRDKQEANYANDVANWPSWETWKQMQTGRKEKVTDHDYWVYKNGGNPWTRQRKSQTPLIPDDGDDPIPF